MIRHISQVLSIEDNQIRTMIIVYQSIQIWLLFGMTYLQKAIRLTEEDQMIAFKVRKLVNVNESASQKVEYSIFSVVN